MPFVVGLLQTTLTMTDCTHRLASDPSGSTSPLCVEISSGLIRQSNDYVPVEEHVPGCPHLCSIWRELNPARPLEGSKFAAASSLQTAAEYEVSAQGGAALLGERAGTFNLKL